MKNLNILEAIKNKVLKKEKKLNTSTGRIYCRLDIEDVHKHFELTPIEEKNGVKRMALILTPNGTRTISYRTDAGKVKALLDIKDKATMESFKDLDIAVKVYDDYIIVEGSPKDTCSDDPSIASSNLLDLAKKKSSKKAATHKVIFDRKFINGLTLKMASGQSFIDQISLSDYFSDKSISKIQTVSGFHPTFKKDVKDAITVASLFCGMGGLDYAFKQNGGFDVCFALDKGFHKETAANIKKYGKHACSAVGTDHIETYRRNIGKHIVDSDVLTFPIEKFPAADVYSVTFPCIELSSVSRSRNNFDMLPKLVDRFIEIMKYLKNSTKVFVIENSDNMLTAGREFLNKIKRELSWFELTEHAVDAADFGSPQHRKRAIIIGSTIGKIHLTTPSIVPVTTVATAFEGLHDEIPNQNHSTYASVSRQETVDRMERIPQGGNWESLPLEMQTKSKFSNYLRRLNPNEKSIAIVNIRKSIIIHPELNRGLTIRECLRLFGFPDTFVCSGDLSSMQQMVCNSIPYHLGKRIAECVKTAFSNIKNTISTVCNADLSYQVSKGGQLSFI